MGQPRAGKSHLAIGIGVALFKEKHKKLIYMPYTEAIMGLKVMLKTLKNIKMQRF